MSVTGNIPGEADAPVKAASQIKTLKRKAQANLMEQLKKETESLRAIQLSAEPPNCWQPQHMCCHTCTLIKGNNS